MVNIRQDLYNAIIRNIEDDDISGFVDKTLRTALKMKSETKKEK